MEKADFRIFDPFAEAVAAAAGDEIEYMNRAALELFGPGADEKRAGELFPALLLDAGGRAAGAVHVGERDFPACADDYCGRRLVTVFAERDDAAERRDRSMLEAALYRVKNEMSVFEMSASLLRSEAESLNDEKLARNTAILDHGCHRLARMVGNVTGICGGNWEARVECFDLAELCGNLTETVRTLSLRKVDVSFELRDGARSFFGDPVLIERLLLNLFSNSLKYTPDGGSIRLTLGRSGKNAVITMSDTGRGIPDDVLPTVLFRFGSGTKTNEPEDGLGLGLAVVQRIARLHGGSAVIESGGRGAVVIVSMPGLPGRSEVRDSVVRRSSMTEVLTELSDVLTYEGYLARNMD